MIGRVRVLMAHSAERGFTLIELLVTMMVFSLAIGMVTSVVIRVQQKTAGAQQSADAVSQVRAALQDIDKQVRSGNVLYTPANETIPTSCQVDVTAKSGSCMRIFTQTNGNEKCVQWQVLADAAGSTSYILRTRSWATDWQLTSAITDWRTVAHGLALDTSDFPFRLDQTQSAYGSRLLAVKFVAKDQRNGKGVTLQSSLSGRNTTYGYDASLCKPVPPE